MQIRWFKLLCRVSLAVWLTIALPSWAYADQVRIGVLAWLDAADAEVQWAPFFDALGRSLPQHRVEAHYMDLERMSDAITRGELDFVVTNPGHYVILESRHGITRIATQAIAKGGDPAHVVGSTVVVRREREDLQNLQDLKAKKLAAVSADAFGGYQVIWAELKRIGLDPERGDVHTLFTGIPMMEVIHSVERGDADAGVIRGCLLEQLERRGLVQAGTLRVLSLKPNSIPCQISSNVYPGWAFAATKQTSVMSAREVLLALLRMPEMPDGQYWSVPADYQPVHVMLKELEIGPYAFMRDASIDSYVRRYWPGVAAMVGLLVLWLIYTLRVEHLVHSRTRALTQAMHEREQLELQMRTHQEKLDHMSRLSVLGELAGTLAHELNQPLTAMANYARSLLLRQSRGNLTADALAQAANEIAQESERAAAILSGIRAFARKRGHVRKRCDPISLTRETVDLFTGMLPHVPEIKVEIQSQLSAPQVWVDPQQIQQVLLNLLKNAYDAHRENGCDAPIEVNLQCTQTHCKWQVRDRGAGMESDALEKLFEPFFTTKDEGLGLGLSICQSILEAHGGKLSASLNAPDAGMSFNFELPLIGAVI